MARLIVLLLFIVVVWLGLRRLLAGSSRAANNDTPAFEKTVRCARCNRYTPIRYAERQGETEAYVCREPCDKPTLRT